MKHILLKILLTILGLNLISCVGGPVGYRPSYRGGGYTNNSGPRYESTPRDFKVWRVNKRTGERELVDPHASPDKVKRLQAEDSDWQWGQANYIDSRGQRMPGSGGNNFGRPTGFQNQGYMQMRSPSGHDFNFDPGGRNYPGPYPRLEYIYTHDPRPRGR